MVSAAAEGFYFHPGEEKAAWLHRFSKEQNRKRCRRQAKPLLLSVRRRGPYNLSIMRNRDVVRFSLVMAPIFALASLLLPCAAQAQNVSSTAMAGAYSVTLRVLPAEAFTGPQAMMVRDSGAEPEHVDGPMHPNHHMVAFIKENGAPVENATVEISYRRVSSMMGAWSHLPVVRMHVAGKGMATTHYGNNLMLRPGNYEARVTVNGRASGLMHFTVS